MTLRDLFIAVVRGGVMLWASLVVLSIAVEGEKTYHVLSVDLAKTKEQWNACYHAKPRAGWFYDECHYILLNPPTNFWIKLVQQTMRHIDYCGVPCDEVFTFRRMLSVVGIFWVVGARWIRRNAPSLRRAATSLRERITSRR